MPNLGPVIGQTEVARKHRTASIATLPKRPQVSAFYFKDLVETSGPPTRSNFLRQAEP